MVSLVVGLTLLSTNPVFPAPAKMDLLGGKLTVAKTARVTFHGIKESAGLREVLASFLPLTSPKPGSPSIDLRLDSKVTGGSEAYRLRIDKGIEISAPSIRGLHWGLQTLRQLAEGRSFPKVAIQDAPKVGWRGVLIDEGRHFMGEATVKRFLDTMALYKFNTLHWLLTEDQGWRIEIKKYPRLTQVGAWRTESDGRRYGGFYTQDQIRRIVKYAADRGIAVVPEVEMPGHSSAALAAYPELGCRRAKLAVPTTWGVFTDVFCAGRESTFSFLEDVLDEVIPLFHSPYLHIGGDEVPKTEWKACADCQARIKSEKLGDEHELQSWFIRRIQAYLAKKDRTLIGWDEILDGGLAKGAVVQVWQDISRAKPAVDAGSPVILSPSSHLYLNRPAEELSMRTVYGHTLRPEGVTPKDVLGHEVTLWSEHITPDNLFERFLPRGIAAAEIFWGDPVRDYKAFSAKMDRHVKWLDAKGIPYGSADSAISTVRLTSLPAKKVGRLAVETGLKGVSVRYTLDGKPPTARSLKIAASLDFPIGKTLTIRPFRSGKPVDLPRVFRSQSHLALGRKIALNVPPAKRYANAGLLGLTDGFIGSDNFDDSVWMGWQGSNLVATVDLGSTQTIREVSISFLQQVGSWIVLPKRVRFDISSDGVSWEQISSLESPLSDRENRTAIHPFRVAKSVTARFVRVTAESYGKLPAWHLGAGGDSWLFADELIVR